MVKIKIWNSHCLREKIIIGRETGDIKISDDSVVSNEHSEIIFSSDGRIRYIDKSRNGSKINGKLVHHNETELKSGDLIEVETTTLKFTSAIASVPSTSTSKEIQTIPTPYQSKVSPTTFYYGAEINIFKI